MPVAPAPRKPGARHGDPGLSRLARLYGVETAYRDLEGRRKPASPEGLMAILQALGAPVGRWDDIPGALRERRQAAWRRTLEPVAVAWDGGPLDIEARLPSAGLASRAEWRVELETGERRSSRVDLAGARAVRTAEVESVRYAVRKLRLPGRLPFGYHRLTLEIGGVTAQALIVSAPAQAYGAQRDDADGRPWGVFLPLHALHSERTWGCGDFSDLEALLDWTHGLGGSAVATLPLLATFLDQPFDPSPYAPASRLFWNELFVDLERVPEFQSSPAAQACFNSPEMRGELAALRSGRLVDYRRTMAAKRRILECLAPRFFDAGDGSPAAPSTPRQQAFEAFLAANPQAEDYACFRAVLDREQRPWTEWPGALGEGTIESGDFDAAAHRTHLYAQWLCHEQLTALADKARRRPPGLCLDLPLGIHPAGYDVWRHRELYAGEVTAGAPPDILFTGGQNWGFPPVHPQAQRQQGYRYHVDCLRHQFRHAGLVRIDHVMGLHRLFWIPQG
ncbi:MAG TPA: 4-alpha-glucanotransferase, partial [Terriglobia bacterium]|nr:4-alpha-glucanotransferase [Terriglobia bacterium]